MKNISKATKMQLAKKQSVKAQISGAQTKKVSRELEQLSERLKHSLRDRGSRARAAKEVSCYVGIDLGDKKSNYCFLDTKGNIFAEGTLATIQAELTELFSSIPKCRIAIEVVTHSPWVWALLKSHGHEVIVANPRKVEAIHQEQTQERQGRCTDPGAFGARRSGTALSDPASRRPRQDKTLCCCVHGKGWYRHERN